MSVAAQWIGRIAMRITDAGNRSVVPFDYAIQQAHQTGVWNERADFRLVDQHIVNASQACHPGGPLIPKRVKVKPVVRRKPHVMLQPLDIALRPMLDVAGAVIAIQIYLLGEMLELNLVTVPAAVETEK